MLTHGRDNAAAVEINGLPCVQIAAHTAVITQHL